jgi:hypothetical protein
MRVLRQPIDFDRKRWFHPMNQQLFEIKWPNMISNLWISEQVRDIFMIVNPQCDHDAWSRHFLKISYFQRIRREKGQWLETMLKFAFTPINHSESWSS